MLETGFRYLIYGSIVGVFLLPFAVAESFFFPFVMGKAFAFRVMVEVMFALWLALALHKRRYRPQFSWVFVALASFVGVALVADLLGVNPARSIWSTFARMEGWVTLLHLLAFFVVLTSMFQTERAWRRLFRFTLGVSGAMALYGLGQLAGVLEVSLGGARLDGLFGNPTIFAGFLLFHIFIALWLLVRSVQKKRHAIWRSRWVWFYVFMFVVNTFVLYHTATRGALLGLLVGLAVTFALVAFFDTKHPRFRIAAAAGIVLIILLAGVFFALRGSEVAQESFVFGRFSAISADGAPTEARFSLWEMALQGFTDRPVLGWGQENFTYVFDRYYDPALYAQGPWFDRAHNAVFDWMINAGALGLFAYLAVFAAVLYYLWRRGAEGTITERAVLTGLLAAYFLHNLFTFDTTTTYVLFGTVLGYIHMRGAVRWRRVWDLSVLARRFSAFLVAGAIFGALLLVLFFNRAGYGQARALSSALSLVNVAASEKHMTRLEEERLLREVLSEYEEALLHESFGSQRALEQLFFVAGAVGRSEVSHELRQEYLRVARLWAERVLAKDSRNGRVHFFYGDLLSAYGEDEDALLQYERALSLSPRRQLFWLRLASAYLAQNKEASARAVVSRGLAGADREVFRSVDVLLEDASFERRMQLEEIVSEVREGRR